MSEEEEVPYVPPSKEQLEWIEKNKQEDLPPEEARKFYNEQPVGDSMEYIKAQIEEAKTTGGIVYDAAKIAESMQHGDVGEPHNCTCLSCRSIWLPKEKQGPGHFGSRFERDWLLRVFAGEYDTPDAILLNDVIEVNCDAGWAIRLRTPMHTCRNCWKSLCCWMDRGTFSVVGFEPNPDPPKEEAS